MARQLASRAREPSKQNDSRSPRFQPVPSSRTPHTRLHGSRPFRRRRRPRVSWTPGGTHVFEPIRTTPGCLKVTGVESGFSLSRSPPEEGLRFGCVFTQLSKMVLQRSVRRARRERSRALAGFIVTWDVDAGNPLQCTRVRRVIFGTPGALTGNNRADPSTADNDGSLALG